MFEERNAPKDNGPSLVSLTGMSDWAELLVFWRQQIDQLAEDFVAGEAVVQPYDLTKSCQYCDLSGICRIQDASMKQRTPA